MDDIEPSDNAPDYRLDAQGNVIAIDNEEYYLRVAGEQEDEV